MSWNVLSSPTGIAIFGTNVYVANSAANTIGRYNLSGGNGTLFANTPSSPFGLDTDGTYLYVTCTNHIVRYSLTGTTPILVGDTLVTFAGATSPFGIVKVGNFLYVEVITGTGPGASGDILQYDTTDIARPIPSTVFANSLPDARGMTTDGAYIYVEHIGQLLRYPLNLLPPVTATIFAVDLNVFGALYLTTDASYLYASALGGDIIEYNLTSTPLPLTSGRTVTNVSGASGLAISGSTLYIVDNNSNTVRLFNLAQPGLGGQLFGSAVNIPSAQTVLRRPYTSGELLALRRQQVERTLTRAPSINLQDSSELTARKRKAASVTPESLPSRGNSTNMVKWRDSSVVQAMREGDAYRASSTNRQVRPDTCTVTCVPNQFLYDTQTDNRFPGITKAIKCDYQVPAEIRVVEPFNLAEHFGMGRNTNKVVTTNPGFAASWASCDKI